jgi:NAD(P)-dependent dehydrogenase (short-subunit alcohol dehydrogenase family)
MASTAGITAGRGGVAYHASKHAVIGLTRTAAREYGARGIRINSICPSQIQPSDEDVDSETLRKNISLVGATYPMGRAGSAEEIAASVVWMCSQGASFVSGHSLVVDGGLLA